MIGRAAAAALLVAAGTLVGCGQSAVSEPSSAFDDVSSANAQSLPASFESREGRPGANGGTAFEPISAPIDDAVAYMFNLGHCGLLSPVDLDGSFWDPLAGTGPSGAPLDLASDSEMINGTAGVVVVIGDEMRFRTTSGSVVRFERHEGDKEFPACD